MKKVHQSFQKLITDYEKESKAEYVIRMKTIFPHIDINILSFFWSSISDDDVFSDLFGYVDFDSVKTYSALVPWQSILCYSSLFPDWIELVSDDPSYRFELYGHDTDVVRSWKEEGTWHTPILVFVPPEASRQKEKKVVFEGHTRVGILKGLLINNESGINPLQRQEVIFLGEL
jgi:hypothetical protein